MKSIHLTFLASWALLFFAPLSIAQQLDPVLVESGQTSVSRSDVLGDALRIPDESRRSALSNPEAVAQMATNLAIRRVMAAEAEASGLGSDPALQGALRIARDRVLSDALIARLDAANRPDPKAVEALARTAYNANPKRFDGPVETGASHILIRKETPDAEAKAKALLAELRAGADFAKLAREHSQDGSGQKGGSLGYFPDGQMVPPFEAALSRLKASGELSEVVETQFGYHIIRLDGRRPAGVRPYEQVRDLLMREAEARVVTEKRMEQVQRVQSTLKLNRPAIEAFTRSVK